MENTYSLLQFIPNSTNAPTILSLSNANPFNNDDEQKELDNNDMVSTISSSSQSSPVHRFLIMSISKHSKLDLNHVTSNDIESLLDYECNDDMIYLFYSSFS